MCIKTLLVRDFGVSLRRLTFRSCFAFHYRSCRCVVSAAPSRVCGAHGAARGRAAHRLSPASTYNGKGRVFAHHFCIVLSSCTLCCSTPACVCARVSRGLFDAGGARGNVLVFCPGPLPSRRPGGITRLGWAIYTHAHTHTCIYIYIYTSIRSRTHTRRVGQVRRTSACACSLVSSLSRWAWGRSR